MDKLAQSRMSYVEAPGLLFARLLNPSLKEHNYNYWANHVKAVPLRQFFNNNFSSKASLLNSEFTSFIEESNSLNDCNSISPHRWWLQTGYLDSISQALTRSIEEVMKEEEDTIQHATIESEIVREDELDLNLIDIDESDEESIYEDVGSNSVTEAGQKRLSRVLNEKI
ncbi:hypothetical protein RCL1_000819 [Eukaryota sp. TZLM3-RCL]